MCSHRIATSSYDYLTKDQYHHIVACLENFRVTTIHVCGGEPLMHPNLHWLINRLKNDFPGTKLFMTTNGDLLDTLSDEEMNSFFRLVISLYDEASENVRNRYRAKSNIFFVDKHRMRDSTVNPMFDIETARQCCRICSKKSIRLVGTKLYGCSLAEGIERTFDTGPLHFTIHPGWHDEVANLPTHLACQHCFQAHDIRFNRSFRRMEHIIRVFQNTDWLFSTYNYCMTMVRKIRNT